MQVCRNDVMFLIFQSFYFFVGFQFHQTGVLGGGEFKTGQKYCLCSKNGAVTRNRTWVIAATTQCNNHYTVTAVGDGQKTVEVCTCQDG